MKYDIFISYRRVGGFETAKHLYDLLKADGYRVSFDIDTLRNGDFDIALFKRIEECRDFILIVDKHAFDRCVDNTFDRKKDWLRCELAYALSQGKNVIPVLLSGVDSLPDNLPEDIAAVVTKNGPKHTIDYFDAFYKKLCNQFLESAPSSVITFSNEGEFKTNMDDWNRPTTKVGKFLSDLFKEK